MLPVGNLRATCYSLLSALAFFVGAVNAGEISGLPPSSLPTLDRDFAFNFSNDFLGRGGSVDDFRTQQIIVSAKLNDRWVGIMDHSILTLTDAPQPGRVDLLSASLGYQLLDASNGKGADRITIGGGLRSAGNFEGERMQNGFHRLIDSNIDSLPYTATGETDATAWIDANRYRDFARLGNWNAAYWLRAASLLTTGGQWDSSVSALAVVNRDWMDIWLGLRHDWRSGYDADVVQIETARAETDTAIVFGVRFGAFMLETVQQLNNDASYGQIILVSSGVRSANKYVAAPKIGIDFGFVLPQVEVNLTGKIRSGFLSGEKSLWREGTYVNFRYGQPQYENDDSLFIDVVQVDAGLEFERPVSPATNWLSYYASLGAGWRNEQLNLNAAGANAKSQGVGRAVATGGAGLRFFAATMGERWCYRLQLGIVATVPLGDATVQIGTEQFTLQKPSLGISLGMTFDFD